MGHNNVVAFQGVAVSHELFLVKPGRYDAVYAGYQGLTIFNVPKVRLYFTLLEYPGITLERWYRVKAFRGRISAGRNSDIVREMSDVLGRRIRCDQIPVGSLANLVVRVTTKNVTTDHRQRALTDINQYSVIERIERDV